MRSTGKDSASRRFITEAEAELRYPFSRKTLQKWRLFNRGPKYYKVGRSVVYDPLEFDDWIRSGARGGDVVA